MGRKYDSKADVFALACVMAELWNLRPLFPGANEIEQLHLIFSVLGSPSMNFLMKHCNKNLNHFSFKDYQKQDLKLVLLDLDLAAVELLEKMLMIDPEERINIS